MIAIKTAALIFLVIGAAYFLRKLIAWAQRCFRQRYLPTTVNMTFTIPTDA